MPTPGVNRVLSPNGESFVANATEFKQMCPDRFQSLFAGLSTQIISCPVINKFGWWVLNSDTSKFNIPKLRLFHFLLFHHKYISCTYEVFERHFIGEETPKEKIIWEGEVIILVLLFNKLVYENKIISLSNESFYDLLISHFLLMNKKVKSIEELKSGSLKSSLNKSRSNAIVYSNVKNFIALLV